MNKEALVKKWFRFAFDDLRIAQNSFDTMWPKPLELICYHCQQCVEKALKGFLADRIETEPAKTHDLEKLCEICAEIDSSFDEKIQEMCLQLTPYAVARYPEEAHIIETDAVLALQKAESIYAHCLSLIPYLEKGINGGSEHEFVHQNGIVEEIARGKIEVAEAAYRAAVESDVSSEALEQIAKACGISEERANEINNEMLRPEDDRV